MSAVTNGLNQQVLDAMSQFTLVESSGAIKENVSPAMIGRFNTWMQGWIEQGQGAQKLDIFRNIFEAKQKQEVVSVETKGAEQDGREKPPSPISTVLGEVKEILEAQHYKLNQFNGTSLTHMIQRETTGDANFFVTELQHKLTEHQSTYKTEQTHTLGQQKETLLDIIKTIGDEVRSEVAEGNISAKNEASQKNEFHSRLKQRLSSPEAKGFFDSASVGQIIQELEADAPALKLRTSLIKKSGHALLNMSEIDLAENLHLVVELDDSKELSEMAAQMESKDKKEINALIDTFTNAEEAYQEAKGPEANKTTLKSKRDKALFKIFLYLDEGENPEIKQAYFKQELNKANSIHKEKSKINFEQIFKSIADPKYINEFIANGVIGAVLGGLGMGSPILGVIAASVIGIIAKAGSSSAQTTTNNSTQNQEPKEQELASSTN